MRKVEAKEEMTKYPVWLTHLMRNYHAGLKKLRKQESHKCNWCVMLAETKREIKTNVVSLSLTKKGFTNGVYLRQNITNHTFWWMTNIRYSTESPTSSGVLGLKIG